MNMLISRLIMAGSFAVLLLGGANDVAQSQARPNFESKVNFPKEVTVNLMPPIPDRLIVRATATVTLKNNSGQNELLFAATPCDIHHWEVLNQSGQVIDSEKDDLCIQVMQTYNLKPNEIIRADRVVALNGKLLRDREIYTLRYKFWRFEAETKFTAIVVR